MRSKTTMMRRNSRSNRSAALPPYVVSEEDDRFYVKRSTISAAGDGLFAAVELKRGDRLRVVGVMVKASSISDQRTSYADPYKIRIGEYLLIPTGWCACVNHRDDGNVEKIVANGEVFLEVRRRIRKDEEIFYRYDEYALARFGPMTE
jgi:hypothetical protein